MLTRQEDHTYMRYVALPFWEVQKGKKISKSFLEIQITALFQIA